LAVGAAVIGYLVYMLIQIGFFYVYYIPKVLRLDSKKIFFGSFFPPVIGAILAFFTAKGIDFWANFPDGMMGILINSAIFFMVFVSFHLLFIIKSQDLDLIRKIILRKND